MLGVYVHLPFCPYLCPYCDFAKWPLRASSARQYLAALYAELRASARERAATIFLGGGTPNAYDAQAIASLVCELREHYMRVTLRQAQGDKRQAQGDKAEEITIEINPELVREGDFERYREAGITRVSIGVQSFDSNEIATLGRKHTPEQVGDVVAAARAGGIGSVSIDLMFAVPGQTPRSWAQSLDRAIALGVDHVSTYGLTVESGTPYAAWQVREPQAFFDDAAEAELYQIALDALREAGYEQYEISNFARPGHRCAHNENYWANGEYVGLGVGAASYRAGVRSVHTRSMEAYVAAAEAVEPIPAEAERLEGLRRTGEAIMLALRTAQGVGLEEFKERYGVDIAEHYAPIIARYSDAGLLERIGDYLRLTERGRFVANDVCGAFLPFD